MIRPYEFEEFEEYFSTIAQEVDRVVRERGWRLQKYYHEQPSWRLTFNHPKGGEVHIHLVRTENRELLIRTFWKLDDARKKKRFMHVREGRVIERTPTVVRAEVMREHEEILKACTGSWNYEGHLSTP